MQLNHDHENAYDVYIPYLSYIYPVGYSVTVSYCTHRTVPNTMIKTKQEKNVPSMLMYHFTCFCSNLP